MFDFLIVDFSSIVLSKIAHQFYLQNNFFAVFELVHGIQHHSVYRLNELFDELPKKILNQWKVTSICF